jgi:hypothetical protein
MATINEITNAAQYTGNAILGGSTSGSFEIKTEPLQQLAYYTMLYNKAERDQKLKEGEEAAKQIADLTNYDLTTAIPKDREEIQKEWNGLIDYARKNPSVLNYRQNPEGFIEYHKKKNDFVNKLTGAKTRNVAYQARQKAIADDTNPLSKALRAKNLDETANGTSIVTPIPTEDSYDLTAPEVKAPTVVTFDVMRKDGMGIAKRDVAMVNMKDVSGQALNISLGLKQDQLDVNSAEFKSLSPEAQQKRIEEFERRKASGRLLYDEMSKRYTDALNQYKDPATGQINVQALSKNGLLSGVIQQIDNYNRYVTTVKDQIRGGVFRDKTGKALQFGMNNLDETDYQSINWQDGISTEELLKVQILSKANPDSYKTSYQETDDDVQRMNAETARINARTGQAELALKDKQWQASQTQGAETVKNGAMERARRMFGDIISIGKSNGQNSVILSPSDVRKLNTEQLKYLGMQTTDKDGKPTFQNLKIDDKDAVQVEFQKDADGRIVDATFRVLGKAKLDKGSGRWIGKWDNTRTTNLFHAATNVLNEELTKAGAKELNAYYGVDVTGETTTNTTGGGNKQSSGSSSSKPKTVVQNGFTYTWNEATQQYE